MSNNQESIENHITGSINNDVVSIKTEFNASKNQDFIIRDLYLDHFKRKAVIAYLDGTVNADTIEDDVISPLINYKSEQPFKSMTELISSQLPIKSYQKVTKLKEISNAIVSGQAVLLIDGSKVAFSLSTTSFESRSVDKPQDETILKGPKEAFVESLAINKSLIRKYLRNKNLVSESIDVGKETPSQVSIMYIEGLANEQLIQMVKERLNKIDAEHIEGLSILEQHIEDRPYSLVPTVLATERPDRAISFLKEGHVILLMDSSPNSLVAPALLWAFLHTAEDHYQRWWFANFIRFTRLLAMFIATFTPAAYIAITNYHIEMLPTDLVLAISATREQVPFPAIIEIILLTISFDLLREGGIRIPTPIGPTIGIVGALILGQAAVEANIISPILVIVSAVTGLATFVIPNISLNFMVRITSIILIFCAYFLGFLGIALFLALGIAYMSSVESFGVPFLSPMAPHYPSSKDLLFRKQVMAEWLRPFNIRPKDKQRMKPGGQQNQ